MSFTTRAIALSAATIGVILLAGCASATPPATPTNLTKAADVVTMTDAWVKSSEEDTSAAFGFLENNSDANVNVVSVTTDAAGMPELHETVTNESGEMVMRPVEGGFVIPAGGKLELAPGGNHIMLMDLTDNLDAGEEVTIELTFSDDSSFAFTAPVKDYAGANETYEGGDDRESGVDG